MTETPYDKAIEETAKATGKALDLVKDAAPAIADIYGIVIGDRIQAARHRRLDEMTRKTRKILKDRDLAETAEVAEQIAIPLLEAAQGEPREEMQELWARLLANAMDPKRRDDVRPIFIATLKDFHPTDAIVLSVLNKHWPTDRVTANTVAEFADMRPPAVKVSLSQLASLRCLDEGGNTYAMTDFGREFLLACQP